MQLTLVSSLLMAFAPQAEKQEAAPPQAQPLAQAIESLLAAPKQTWKAQISESAPAAQAAGVMVIDGSGGQEPFAGGVEVTVAGPQEALIVSDETLPEVVVYRKSDRQITRTTSEGRPADASRLADDLLPLLDLDRLAKAARHATWTTQVDAATHATTWLGEIDRKLVKPGRGGPMGIATPKVLRINARITTSADGKLMSMRFEVVRNDPFGGVREQALRGGVSGTISAAELDSDDAPHEGASAIYELKPSSAAPCARAQKLLAVMREVCNGE